MNFNAFFLKSFRVLLLPFALLYGFIITIRNYLYDKKYLRSAKFGLPLICVGNLSVGGTGKSPMVEYLVELLGPRFETAILSRGYKRKTKGYALASERTTALEIGDEPMQFHRKYPNLTIAVGEERIVAIPQLLHDKPGTQVVVLDDAFQHRAIKAGLNILLTDCGNLFMHDWFLPTGDLRDERKSYRRADIIVVTKCPETLTETEKNKIIAGIKPLPHQQVFFTTIEYGQPYHIVSNEKRVLTTDDEVLLVCGIANPKPLKQYLAEHTAIYYQQSYRDHHIFSIDDLRDIRKKYEQLSGSQKFILTTEKDAVRLTKFSQDLAALPLFVLPIRHRFLFNGTEQFNRRVVDFIQQFQTKAVS
ncbi:tetraacyldisaccharide 4'-kinase [Deminuibacter soli]|uniref:Tetraacyldisaccharide 4'-kinase n=1 Tax=Deminuibacter soli TaxID=2291815 RepID=A0A3E1NJM7_9BACT|nr:tetraacyldisaccharide 4'-kinase [Deminuibacter soli]RFM28081.1 tetraacyldisaccharide 4'-kinase [Deminuibacter soli]